MRSVLLESTSDFKFLRNRKYKTIPGWNDHLKELHTIARKYFLQWRLNGKPLNGSLLDNMKNSRNSFRSALKHCRNNEDEIKNKKMVNSLVGKKYKDFWRDVHTNKNGNVLKQVVIDNESSPQNIAEKFSLKYNKVLDKYQDGCSKAETIEVNLSNCTSNECLIRTGKVDVKMLLINSNVVLVMTLYIQTI